MFFFLSLYFSIIFIIIATHFATYCKLYNPLLLMLPFFAHRLYRAKSVLSAYLKVMPILLKAMSSSLLDSALYLWAWLLSKLPNRLSVHNFDSYILHILSNDSSNSLKIWYNGLSSLLQIDKSWVMNFQYEIVFVHLKNFGRRKLQLAEP